MPKGAKTSTKKTKKAFWRHRGKRGIEKQCQALWCVPVGLACARRACLRGGRTQLTMLRHDGSPPCPLRLLAPDPAPRACAT